MAEAKKIDEYQGRVEKLQQLRNQHTEPWPGPQVITATCAQLIKDYQDGVGGHEYTTAGRLMTRREHGKTAFGHIQDRSGRLQMYVKLDIVGQELFNFFTQTIDLGDIIWCKGTPFTTKTGEITLNVTDIKLLSKCLHPLPEKFHGVTDIETKYRQRYLDLMTNEETRERFMRRSTIIKAVRSYLDAHDFLEVETPMLHPIPGGAAARPFITHHNALDSDFYLRIAPELYLKRLVVGGFERVYEINRNFRNEGISTRHNPEFTMVEFYMAHQDYHFIMQFVETMLREMVQKTCGTLQVRFGDALLDFAQPFARMSAQQALIEHGKLTKEQLEPQAIDATIKRYNITLPTPHASHGQKIFALFEELAEKCLVQPTFIIDFPIEISPLAKRDTQNPAIAARFELFIAGMEISNGFNELNDPFDQAERFKEQAQAHVAGDSEAMHYDADYIQTLEYGLPPTVGVGIGIDRLVMLLTNTTSIKEVILFPTLKKK